MSMPSTGASVRTRHARMLSAGLPRTYHRVGWLLSGQDPRWRRFMVSRVPTTARTVLDVATGTGMVAREVAARTSGRVVGLDQSEAMLAGGVAETAGAG